MHVIGIDPGLSGAIAMVGPRGLANMADIPIMPRATTGATVKNQVNAAALAALLREWHHDLDRNEMHVVIEKVSAMPSFSKGERKPQGSASTFSLGLTAGIIEGVVVALGFSHEIVAPSTWKKAMKLTSSKNETRAAAQRLYPGAPLTRVKDHNRAEAIMLARYGYERLA